SYQHAEYGQCNLDREFDGFVRTFWKMILKISDAHVQPLATGQHPAEHGEPHHQEARELVGPDQRLAERARDHTESDAAEQRRDQRTRNNHGSAIEATSQGAKHRDLEVGATPHYRDAAADAISGRGDALPEALAPFRFE